MTAKEQREAFLVDCIARALATLPYATIDDGGEEIRAMQAAVRAPSHDGVAVINDTLHQEVATHEACGNYIKAEVIDTFRCEVVGFVNERTRKAARLRDAVHS